MNNKNNERSRRYCWSLAVGTCLLLCSTAFADDALQGGWVLTQVVDAEGNVDDAPLPGLVVFTSTHYSMMFTVGDKPRAVVGELPEGDSATDAQLVEAYRSFIANSGRYEAADGTITTRAFVAKSPDYMAGWPDNAQAFTYSIDGETLVILSDDGPTAGAKSTFMRVEGKECSDPAD
jgi:hypothetical protein